jgi:carbonic anhydrase
VTVNAITGDDLLRHNRAWAAAQRADDPESFVRSAKGQCPRFLWIGCSDSRVPPNTIVGLPPGELFVHRNIANIVNLTDTNCMAVVQHAVATLKVSHILVVGHYGCAGVTAALNSDAEGILARWLDPISVLAAKHCPALDALTDTTARADRLSELSVAAQVANVAQIPSVLERWQSGGVLSIHGWIYNLRDGLLRDLGLTTNAPQET